MARYDYKCPNCKNIQEVIHSVLEEIDVECVDCDTKCHKTFLSAPGVAVPPQHQASPDKMKYYGIKNFATGEGITKDTNLSVPPGISVSKGGAGNKFKKTYKND